MDMDELPDLRGRKACDGLGEGFQIVAGSSPTFHKVHLELSGQNLGRSSLVGVLGIASSDVKGAQEKF
jgi:hypothetical protein